MWRKNLVNLLFTAGLLIAFPLVINAQPDTSRDEFLFKVQSTRALIDEFSKKIGREPSNASLYSERGALRRKLFMLINRTNLAPLFPNKKLPADLVPRIVINEAVADYTQAISLAPEPQFVAGRGETYAVRWFGEISKIYWYGAIEKAETPEWRDYAYLRKKENELKVFERVWSNPDFALAVADLETALSKAPDTEFKSAVNYNLARVYLERAQNFTKNIEHNRSMLTEPNKFGYAVFDDIDKGIAYFEASGKDASVNFVTPIPFSFLEAKSIARRSVYLYRAETELLLRKYDAALKTLDHAAQFNLRNDKNDFFQCSFFSARGRANLALGNLDAAIADTEAFKYAGDPSPRYCLNASEIRGHAFFRKGLYDDAIREYSTQLAYPNLSVNVAEIYKNRGLAYRAMGQHEKALEDFIKLNYNVTNAENIRLRAAEYRALNQAEKAAEDEESAKLREELDARAAGKRSLYGLIKIPGGRTVSLIKAEVMLIYSDGKKERWTPSVDEKGRFVFNNIENKPFRLFAYVDTNRGGAGVRLYARTAEFSLDQGEIVGPITITLDKSARRNSAVATIR